MICIIDIALPDFYASVIIKILNHNDEFNDKTLT